MLKILRPNSENVCAEPSLFSLVEIRMPYLRQRRRIPANGRVAVKMTPAQRDLFIGPPEIPASLTFALKRAPVRDGKLSVRVTSSELDALIVTAARISSPDKLLQRRLDTLLGYLESLEDRFELPDE